MRPQLPQKVFTSAYDAAVCVCVFVPCCGVSVRQGCSVLHAAVGGNQMDTLLWCLRAGASVNAQDVNVSGLPLTSPRPKS